MPVPLSQVVAWLDDFLGSSSFQDASKNGLQVGNRGWVHKLATAVDAREATLQGARDAGADLLLVHHGLFWKEPELLTGVHLARVRGMLEGDLSLYAAHLPLDAHAEVGHNAALGAALGLIDLLPFGMDRLGQVIGRRGRLPVSLDVDAFSRRLQEAVAPFAGGIHRFGQGPLHINTVGIVTGDAADWVVQAEEAGLDAFVTGETDHATACLAEEMGIHLFSGGHYATETFGVRALGERVARQFDLPVTFIHRPTGL